MKSIAIVTHKYLPQPDDDLALYLNRKRDFNVLYIKHSFPDAPDRRSSVFLYRRGKLDRRVKTLDYKFLPEFLVYIKETFFTFKWLVTFELKIDTYLGMDGLCTFWGILLRKIGVCRKVIYWCIDFVPQSRFKVGWKNSIYHKINIYACKNADEVWDLSPRMKEGRKKYLGIDEKDYKSRKVVPYGLWVNRIKRISYGRCEEGSFVFMGHLLPKQGVDIVLKGISDIVKVVPQFKFKIIGDGSFKNELVKLVRELDIEKYCRFLGRLEAKEMEREIAKSVAAVAPYKKTKDNYSYYADSGKVKTYLACGVPVLLTDLPWNAKEIQQKKCGLIIKDSGDDLSEKMIRIMKPNINKKFRENAIKYSENFDYEKIFSNLEL